jgi:hypothetical protein
MSAVFAPAAAIADRAADAREVQAHSRAICAAGRLERGCHAVDARYQGLVERHDEDAVSGGDSLAACDRPAGVREDAACAIEAWHREYLIADTRAAAARRAVFEDIGQVAVRDRFQLVGGRREEDVARDAADHCAVDREQDAGVDREDLEPAGGRAGGSAIAGILINDARRVERFEQGGIVREVLAHRQPIERAVHADDELARHAVERLRIGNALGHSGTP